MNSLINQQFCLLAEDEYKQFNLKLIPTEYQIIGIRMSALKRMAKDIASDSDVENYLKNAEFTTYEHILLYGLVLSGIKKMTLETIFTYLDPLILKFDNWAHVDCIISTFKIFKHYPDMVFNHFLPLKKDGGEFTKRVFVIILMNYLMDERCVDSTLKHLSETPQGQYYVDMAIAWAISYGLIKFYDQTFPLLENRSFSKFVHNKAIQKARESYRVAPEIKERLNKMRL